MKRAVHEEVGNSIQLQFNSIRNSIPQTQRETQWPGPNEGRGLGAKQIPVHEEVGGEVDAEESDGEQAEGQDARERAGEALDEAQEKVLVCRDPLHRVVLSSAVSRASD